MEVWIPIVLAGISGVFGLLTAYATSNQKRTVQILDKLESKVEKLEVRVAVIETKQAA